MQNLIQIQGAVATAPYENVPITFKIKNNLSNIKNKPF